MNCITRSFLSLLSSGCLLFLTAVPPSIGVVRSDGDFQMDGSTVRGNATLLEGSTVQTSGTQSRIQLSGGAEIVLSPASRAQVYRDHTVLQQGAQSVKNGKRYRIEAASLWISPTDTKTLAEIVAKGGNRVSIAAREGSVDVRNGAGVLVATVRPGLALAFDTQGGGTAKTSRLSGCLVAKSGKYLLTDSTTSVTVELQGPDAVKSAGHRVEITGQMVPDATPVEGASQVIQVVTVDSVGAACGELMRASRGQSGGGAAGAGAGLSTGAIVAVVAGVAVVGTVVGLAVAGTFSGGKSQPPASTP